MPNKQDSKTVKNPKHDIGQRKPSFHHIPPSALVHMGAACKTGGDKYGIMNYREAGVTASVYYNAMIRHLLRYWDGQDVDESGCLHLAHAMSCCAILIDCAEKGVLIDDRPVHGNVDSVLNRMTKEVK